MERHTQSGAVQSIVVTESWQPEVSHWHLWVYEGSTDAVMLCVMQILEAPCSTMESVPGELSPGLTPQGMLWFWDVVFVIRVQISVLKAFYYCAGAGHWSVCPSRGKTNTLLRSFANL